MKILVIKSSSMGDIIHALPVASDIAEHVPGACVDWVVEESFRDIPTFSPYVSSAVVTAFRRWRKHPFSSETRAEVARLKDRLRSGRYDIVLDIQGLARTGLVVHWAGAPRAAGFSFSTVREQPAALFYTPSLRFALDEDMGAVSRYRALAGLALGYKPEGLPRFGLRATRPNPVSVGSPYAALAVNTSRDSKLWPEDRWVRLMEDLKGMGLRSVLFWWSDSEKARVERLASRTDAAVVAPRMGYADIAAVLAGAEIVVGADTGIAHMGAALGRPTVGIYVQSNPERTPIVGDAEHVSLGGFGRDTQESEVLDCCRRFLK